MRQIKTADEVIQDIAETLAQWDGEDIQEIANKVLSGRVEYIEDSTFEVFWDEPEEDDNDEGLTEEQEEE